MVLTCRTYRAMMHVERPQHHHSPTGAGLTASTNCLGIPRPASKAHCKRYPYIHDYFLASFLYFNGTGNKAGATLQCGRGRGFIITSIYHHRRIRNRLLRNLENSPENISGYADIFSVHAAGHKTVTGHSRLSRSFRHSTIHRTMEG